MRLITKVTLGLTIILALSWIIVFPCNDGTRLYGGSQYSILPQFIKSSCWEIIGFALWGSMIGGPILVALWLFIVIRYFKGKKKK